MRRLALDTNAYRALNDGNPTLVELITFTPDIALPVTVVGEIYAGIFSGTRASENAGILRRFLDSPRNSVLAVTDETARLFGEVYAELRRTGKPMQQNDIWIAALCKQYDYPLVTADKGFENVTGLEVITF